MSDPLVESCIFCKILAGQGEASVVYRDAWVTAFLDIDPVVTGHLLVVPNQHAARLTDLDEESGVQVFAAARRLAAALYASGLRCEGINYFLADGATAGQEVPHVHLHVIPRHPGDAFNQRLLRHDFQHAPTRAALDETAAKIREGLSRSGGRP